MPDITDVGGIAAPADALGEPVFAGPVSSVGGLTADADAFGPVVLAGPVSDAGGIAPDADALGPIAVGLAVTDVGGIAAPADALGAPQVNLAIASAGGIAADADALGAIVVAGPISDVGGIAPDADAFGPVAVGLAITDVGGIAAPADAIGAPQVNLAVVDVGGIAPDTDALGGIVVAGPITVLDGIAAPDDAFGELVLANYGPLLLVGANGIVDVPTGDVEGGDEILLAGSGIDMSTVSDDFADGVLSWTTSGRVGEVIGGLELRAGPTAGEQARATAPGLAAVSLDATAAFSVLDLSFAGLASTDTIAVARLGFDLGGGTDAWLEVLASRRTLDARFTVRKGGVLRYQRSELLSAAGGGGGGGRRFGGELRVLRVTGALCAVVGVGGATATFEAGWVAAAASPIVGCRNGTVGGTGGTVLTRVTAFRRVPVVLFTVPGPGGGVGAGSTVPATAATSLAPSRATARVPSQALPGSATVSVVGPDGSTVVPAGDFVYTLDRRNFALDRSFAARRRP